MIEGLNVRCTVGAFEVLRTAHLKIVYRRRSVLTRAEIDIPDPSSSIKGALTVGQAVNLKFSHRGESASWHSWQGTIDGFSPVGPDAFRVLAVGHELALQKTKITESYFGEPALTVARRIMGATGLPLGKVDIPDAILPHIIFSRVPVARALRQIAQSLHNSFGYDFSSHAVWLGKNGLNWSSDCEPGQVHVVASGENLIEHAPALEPYSLSLIDSTLLPGLGANQQVRLIDARRGINCLIKGLAVEHVLESRQSFTRILYGAERGWH